MGGALCLGLGSCSLSLRRTRKSPLLPRFTVHRPRPRNHVVPAVIRLWGMADNEESFAEALYKEVASSGTSAPMVEMLLDMASVDAPDYDTIADAVGFVAEMGSPDLAAAIIRRFLKAADPTAPTGGVGPSAPSPSGQSAASAEGGNSSRGGYSKPALILSRMVDGGNLTSAIDILKFLLVPHGSSGSSSGNSNGQGMLDCYDFSMVLGTMVQEKKSESAGRILFALFSETQSEDSKAAQTLVPFVLGTLIDQGRSDWTVEMAMQLMYTTIEEIEAGSDEYDYSVTGWCLAQMVWFGRADWAARVCLDLQQHAVEWYDHAAMMESVANWGDRSYSQTIINFMKQDGSSAGGGGGRGHGPRR